MADDKKVKKTKKKKEDDKPEVEAPPAAAPPAEKPPRPPTPIAVVEEEETVQQVVAVLPSKKTGSKGSRKAQRTGSDVYAVFSQKQVSEFKEAFHMMDDDKDGIINKNDLRSILNKVGKVASDAELNEMLGEASGPLNFTMLLTLFANRMSGSVDEDDVVMNAFKRFDEKGKIDSEKLKFQLMTFGDKFTEEEVEDAFANMMIDGVGRIDTNRLICMLTATEEEES